MLAPFLLNHPTFFMLQKQSPCKVNLLLNILGKREDGFHELETVMFPVPLCDLLTFDPSGERGIHLTIGGSPGRRGAFMKKPIWNRPYPFTSTSGFQWRRDWGAAAAMPVSP